LSACAIARRSMREQEAGSRMNKAQVEFIFHNDKVELRTILCVSARMAWQKRKNCGGDNKNFMSQASDAQIAEPYRRRARMSSASAASSGRRFPVRVYPFPGVKPGRPLPPWVRGHTYDQTYPRASARPVFSSLFLFQRDAGARDRLVICGTGIAVPEESARDLAEVRQPCGGCNEPALRGFAVRPPVGWNAQGTGNAAR
jgi:hypothetical protein